jgi:hypothetical protein
MALAIVLFLVASAGTAWCLAAEMLVVSTAPIGPTPTLCLGPIQQYKAFVAILDQPVWYTLHSTTATPSASLGALGSPGTTLIVDRATEFRAVRQGAVDARLYVVCLP